MGGIPHEQWPGENPVWRWFIYLKFEDTKTLGLKVNIKTVSGLDKPDSSVIGGGKGL